MSTGGGVGGPGMKAGEGLGDTVTTKDVQRAREMADRSGTPFVWQREDPVEGLPIGMRHRIEKELNGRSTG